MAQAHRPNATRYGFRFKCNPANGVKCIPIKAWGTKYHYSFEQIRTLARKGLIAGHRYKGALFIEDKAPPEGC